MTIERIDVSVTTTGGGGASTGNTTTTEIVNGFLVAVYIDATGGHANTDWVFADAGLGITLFTLTNINTTGFYAPLLAGVTAAAGAAITDSGVAIPVTGRLKCTISSTNDGTYAVKYFIQR